MEVARSYHDRGIERFLISWSPAASPANLIDHFRGRGLTVKGQQAKLYRRAEPMALQDSTLSVSRVTSSEALLYGELVARGHGDPPELAGAHGATVGRPDWSHYLVYADGVPIAGGCLFHQKNIAWCGFAATLSEHRRRGAQSALLRQRVSDAAALGAEWVVCEAAPDTVERPSASYRNMVRAGFEVAYVRPNILCETVAYCDPLHSHGFHIWPILRSH